MGPSHTPPGCTSVRSCEEPAPSGPGSSTTRTVTAPGRTQRTTVPCRPRIRWGSLGRPAATRAISGEGSSAAGAGSGATAGAGGGAGDDAPGPLEASAGGGPPAAAAAGWRSPAPWAGWRSPAPGVGLEGTVRPRSGMGSYLPDEALDDPRDRGGGDGPPRRAVRLLVVELVQRLVELVAGQHEVERLAPREEPLLGGGAVAGQ